MSKNGPDFFETGMGRKFYEGTMPKIAHALESIATSLERLADAAEQAKKKEEEQK